MENDMQKINKLQRLQNCLFSTCVLHAACFGEPIVIEEIKFSLYAADLNFKLHVRLYSDVQAPQYIGQDIDDKCAKRLKIYGVVPKL